MANIGHVDSTALTGEASPTFIRNVAKVAAPVAFKTKAEIELEEAHKKIDDLTRLMQNFLASQASVVEEAPVELTAGEKAAVTRAANKAKAEAEAKVGE